MLSYKIYFDNIDHIYYARVCICMYFQACMFGGLYMYFHIYIKWNLIGVSFVLSGICMNVCVCVQMCVHVKICVVWFCVYIHTHTHTHVNTVYYLSRRPAPIKDAGFHVVKTSQFSQSGLDGTLIEIRSFQWATQDCPSEDTEDNSHARSSSERGDNKDEHKRIIKGKWL